MFIDKFDDEVLNNLISSYESIDLEIKSLGEDVVREHTPELLKKREVIREYIVRYSQLFKNMVNADNMSVEEISVYLKENSHKNSL